VAAGDGELRMTDDVHGDEVVFALEIVLHRNFSKGSKSWEDYSRAKIAMECIGFDFFTWQRGIDTITDYLEL